MTLLMRDKAKYNEGLEQGRLNEIFSSVQEGDYSAQRGAQKANMTLPKFENTMEKAGYTNFSNSTTRSRYNMLK